MFDLLVDIYAVPEETTNAEPQEGPGTLLYADVPATFLRFSGNSRMLAAGAGLVLDGRMAIEHRESVTDQCEVRNVRTREGNAMAEQPAAYRVMFPNIGARRHHVEMDLQAVT